MEFYILLLERWSSIMLRAFLTLGSLYFVFWYIKPNWTKRFRIVQPKQVRPIYKSELPRAVISLSIYLIPTSVLYFLRKQFNFSMMYTEVDKYGYVYFVVSLFLFAVVIDTWFYWAHRLMHSMPYLKKVHQVHHNSYNITPVSAYSFHIVESLIVTTPWLIMLVAIPWHPVALLIFSVGGLLYNGYLHLGFDFFYIQRSQHPLLKWLYSATHHSIHHQIYDGNYAVYFSFWDKLMGTEISTNPAWEKSRPNVFKSTSRVNLVNSDSN